MRFYSYTIRYYRLQIIIALGVFGGLIYASAAKPEWHTGIDWLDSIAGVGTLVLACFLWINNIRREWENNLPKRITVQYQWQGRNVMVCYDALLVSESDAALGPCK